ncbi:MAG: P63C domain-containing protein [Hyphomicrobiaceae bacterium]
MVDETKVPGGIARAKALSQEERTAIARRAALSRHRADMPKAIAEGDLKIGDLLLSCAVLDDTTNTRVLTQNAFLKAIGRHPFASGGTGSAIDESAPFLRAKNLKSFISNELERSTTPIMYLPRNPTAGAGGVGYGYRASLLPGVCWVYQDAMLAGKLLPNQLHIGEACKAFLKALTNYAIEDLIDEATGFADLRKRRALDRIIERYVRKDAQAWAKLFDIDFYRQIYRLNGWEFDPENNSRPGVIGHWTNDIYDRLAPGIRDELHRRVRRNASGKPTQKLSQWLTPEEGKPEMRRLLEGVTVAMKLSDNWDDFRVKLDRLYPRFGDTLLLPFDDPPKPIAKV